MGPIEYYYLIPKERGLDWTRCRGSLSYKDSNLDKQDQNLLCYHYTMRQWRSLYRFRCRKCTPFCETNNKNTFGF